MMPGTSDTCSTGSASKHSGGKQRPQSVLAECLVLTQLYAAWCLGHLMSSQVTQLLRRCLQNAPATSKLLQQGCVCPFQELQQPCMLTQGRH